ncbi:MAG: SPASM domain-containing protein [Thermoflexales bacterium]|nr:SPASM domain-containing protein [Thermoflexales bacterium]
MKPIWAVRDKGRWLRRRANQITLHMGWRLRLPRPPGLPRIVMIEPTNECNLHCPLCPTGNGTLKRAKGRMSFDLYQRILAELDGALERLMLYNYGEPFLHPQIFDMIALARQAEIHTRISTNGLVLMRAAQVDELIASQLDYLRISLDGATPETYALYRQGGQFERLLEGARLLQQRKRQWGLRRPVVELQFIVMRHNEHELDAVRQIAHELGALLRIKTVGLGKAAKAAQEQWLPAQPALRRYEERDGRLELAHSKPSGYVCDHPWHRLVVNWDGQVTPCCYDWDGLHEFGNAAEGMQAVWHGERMQAFRRALQSAAPPAMCQRCAVRLWNTPRLARIERTDVAS